MRQFTMAAEMCTEEMAKQVEKQHSGILCIDNIVVFTVFKDTNNLEDFDDYVIQFQKECRDNKLQIKQLQTNVIRILE